MTISPNLNRYCHEGACPLWTPNQLSNAFASYVAFWLVLFLALADRQVRHPRWRPILLEALGRSLREPLVCQALASRAVNETIKPGQGVVLDVPFVQPERKFVNITAKMLAARMMVDAYQAALEDGEDTLNSVCGDGAAHIFTGAVVDRFMPEGTGFDAVISASLIRIQHRAGFDALGNRVLNSRLGRCWR
jgi:hypothetical protein